MNKRQSISCALIILSALLFGPANALALSDLDTKFRGVKTDEQGQERHLYCDLLTITNGTLICRIGNLDDRIPLSHVKQLDVEYMGKRYVVSNINKSDIDSANAMSAKKEEAFYRQEKAMKVRKSIDSIARQNIQRGEGLLDTWQPSVNPSVELSSESIKKDDADQERYDQAIADAVSNLSSWQPPDNKEEKSETTEDIPIFVLIIFVSITWIISLTPSLLIRFIFIKRPIGKWKAIATVATLWFINIFIATALGSNGKTHWGTFFVAWASYAILRKSNKNKQSSESSCNEQIKEKKQ